jgi:hypothetical protein
MRWVKSKASSKTASSLFEREMNVKSQTSTTSTMNAGCAEAANLAWEESIGQALRALGHGPDSRYIYFPQIQIQTKIQIEAIHSIPTTHLLNTNFRRRPLDRLKAPDPFQMQGREGRNQGVFMNKYATTTLSIRSSLNGWLL